MNQDANGVIEEKAMVDWFRQDIRACFRYVLLKRNRR